MTMRTSSRAPWYSRALVVAVVLVAGNTRAQPTTAPATDMQTVSFPATIEAYWSADLYSKTSGYVDDVKADLGDRVTKGQVLAALRVPELEKNLAQANATLAAKKQMHEAAKAVVKQVQQAQAVAQKQLEIYRADVEYHEINFKRQQELSASAAATPQQFDEARHKAQVAKASMGVGEAKVTAAEADVLAAIANREVAAAQVQVAEAAMQEIITLQEYTKITAPFDGIITRRQASPGDLVQAATASRTTPLFNIQQIDTVRIFCDVPELRAAAVSTDSEVEVKVYGLEGRTIPAKITRLATSLNPVTRTMRAEIDLPNPGQRLRPGMYAQVTLKLAGPATRPAGSGK